MKNPKRILYRTLTLAFGCSFGILRDDLLSLELRNRKNFAFLVRRSFGNELAPGTF